jgi:hypothetical protein
MKAKLAIAVVCVGLQIEAEPMEWQPSELSPHQTVWVRRDDKKKVAGSYVEIQSGLNRQLENGKWERASDEIEVFERGAVARKTQFRAVFAGGSDGTFDIQLPERAGRLRGKCVGVAYTDGATGESVFIGEIRNVQGFLMDRNEVLYPDCFTGIKADLRFCVTVGSIAQDVILREKLPSPDQFGLNPATTRLELWTRLFDSPNPRKDLAPGRALDGAGASDFVLDFGSMQIGPGKAHPVGRDGTDVFVTNSSNSDQND